MESKKQQSKAANVKACQSSDSNRKPDLQVNKPWPRNSRRREQPSARRNETVPRNAKQNPSAKARPNVDKRPRPRGDGGAAGHNDAACEIDDVLAPGSGLALVEQGHGTGAVPKSCNQYELYSVYSPGSKKQSLNHLLNFQYTPRELDYPGSGGGFSVFGRNGGRPNNARNAYGGGGAAKKQSFNKEQYLQANFQFVVKSCAKAKLSASPDTLISWDLIEQINIQTTEEPQCPICLYPPIAAKLTRCGHAYCWPCILHYLALSDKAWRKCPICYEAIHKADLKSTAIIQQRDFGIGERITFQLMRRKKNTLFVEKFKSLSTNAVEHYPYMSSDDDIKLFSKVIIATRANILNIIERERNELAVEEDDTSPEFVFIEQALELLNERREKLGEIECKDEDGKGTADKTSTSITAPIGETAANVASAATGGGDPADGDPQTMEHDNRHQTVPDRHAAASMVEELGDEAATLGSHEAGTAAKYYYFYQAEDGQNVFLHPINVKMLQMSYGTLESAPLVINARVLEKEHHSMDEVHRRKFTCLSHLPLTCHFVVVEVDLQCPIISEDTFDLFQDEIAHRRKERHRRERDERKREKEINVINDRQMGKLIASTANLNLSSAQEFPSCGFEEFLPSSDHSVATTPNRHVSYSTIAVARESPKQQWPTLAAPIPASTSNNHPEPSAATSPTNIWKAKPSSTAVSGRILEDESTDGEAKFHSMQTSLGDVLAEAMLQKKQHTSKPASTPTVGKKNKKAKKMQPIFSTGMSYQGN